MIEALLSREPSTRPDAVTAARLLAEAAAAVSAVAAASAGPHAAILDPPVFAELSMPDLADPADDVQVSLASLAPHGFGEMPPGTSDEFVTVRPGRHRAGAWGAAIGLDAAGLSATGLGTISLDGNADRSTTASAGVRGGAGSEAAPAGQQTDHGDGGPVLWKPLRRAPGSSGGTSGAGGGNWRCRRQPRRPWRIRCRDRRLRIWGERRRPFLGRRTSQAEVRSLAAAASRNGRRGRRRCRCRLVSLHRTDDAGAAEPGRAFDHSARRRPWCGEPRLDGSGPSGTHSAGAPAPGASGPTPKSQAQGNGKPASTPSSSPGGSSASSSPSSSPSPSPSLTGPVLPPGYVWHRFSAAILRSTAGFEIGLPSLWKQSVSGQSAYLAEPLTNFHLTVDLAPWTYVAPLTEAQYLERQYAKTDTGFKLLTLGAIGFKAVGGFKVAPAAELKFTWTKPSAGTVTELVVLVSLTTKSGVQPYSLTLWAPSATFSVADGVFHIAMTTFRPLPA